MGFFWDKIIYHGRNGRFSLPNYISPSDGIGSGFMAMHLQLVWHLHYRLF